MSLNRLVEAAQKPKKILRVAGYKLLGLWGTREFRPFVVLTKARTGSNLLISLLDSHPNIRAEGELFRDLNRKLYAAALDLVFSRQPRYIKASGFKIFYSHTTKDGDEGVWGRLLQIENLAVIHLKRRNLLRAITSRKIAGAQGVWLADKWGKQQRKDKAVSIAAEELERGFQRIRRQEEWGDKTFHDCALINVTYEDLVVNTNVVFRELTDFLGVPYFAPKANLLKQNPDQLKDLIVNYDELKSKFAGSEWQHFFED